MEHLIHILNRSSNASLLQRYTPELDQANYETQVITDEGVSRTEYQSYDEAETEHSRMPHGAEVAA